MGRLDDKIAIVTGAGQGIGRAIAGKLATEGAIVVVTDVDEASAQVTADAWPGSVAIRADVADRQGVQTLADRVVLAVRPHRRPGQQRRLGQRPARSSIPSRPTGTARSRSTCTGCCR
jgi:NAD(P)-dependent dehydrogenase (short-subunit alcohol dehydrogenase family)